MARERINQMLASEVAALQMAVVAAISGGDHATRFNRLIQRLQG